MKFVVRADGQERTIVVTEDDGHYVVDVDGRSLIVDCRSFGDKDYLSMLIDNESYIVESAPVKADEGRYYARVMGRHYDLDVFDELLVAVKEAELATDTGGVHAVCAPMPGLIVDVRVAVGEAVNAGAPVVIMEAMKMQNELVADISGVVTEILVSPKDTVDSQTPLVVIERDG